MPFSSPGSKNSREEGLQRSLVLLPLLYTPKRTLNMFPKWPVVHIVLKQAAGPMTSFYVILSGSLSPKGPSDETELGGLGFGLPVSSYCSLSLC